MRRLCSHGRILNALVSLMMEWNVFWMNRGMKLNRTLGLLSFLYCVGRYRSKVNLMGDCWRGTFNNQSVKQITIIMRFLGPVALKLLDLSIFHTVKHFIMCNRICRLKILLCQITEHHVWRIIYLCSLFPSIPYSSSVSLLIDSLGPGKVVLSVAHFK